MENASTDRPVKQALWYGWHRRCPSCGSGNAMSGYLKVADQCDVCGEELYHHRADDGPAWATIIITGHLLAPLMLTVFELFRPEGWQMAIGFSVVFLALSLYLLPRFKAMFVAMQWAKRMHGFGEKKSA